MQPLTSSTKARKIGACLEIGPVEGPSDSLGKKYDAGIETLSPIETDNKKEVQKKSHHRRICVFYSSFSSVQRVLGRPVNVQSLVNAYAILLIALTKLCFNFFF